MYEKIVGGVLNNNNTKLSAAAPAWYGLATVQLAHTLFSLHGFKLCTSSCLKIGA